MDEELDTIAKQTGDVLIDMSDLQDAKMEKWSDVSKRPNDLSETECAGFINKESASAGLNLVLDIQAPAGGNEAVLRIWGIESKQDSDGNERFNNIQLDFMMDYTTARVVTQKAEAITRDDIRAALHDTSTRLSRMTISSQSGFDKVSLQPLGERYDVVVDELDEEKAPIEKMKNALSIVEASFKDSVAAAK